MIVRITYDDQRLDVFDTSTFTAALPLGKANMLTNFEVRFDAMGEGGLWLAAHSYQACGEHEDEDGDIPVARRTKGWRFLLSSAEELEHVELVVVDGEAIIKRVLGHLIDLQSFDEAAYECTGTSPAGLHARIAELYEYMQAISGKESPDIPGVDRETVAACVSAHAKAQAESDKESEQDWGDINEVGW